MIITELKYQERFPDRFDNSQRIQIKCDVCHKEYESPLSNRNKCFEKYKSDLCRSCKQKKQYAEGLRNEQMIAAGNAAIKLMKGKTYNEIFDAETTKRLLNMHKNNWTKEGNPNFGAKYSRGFADRPLYGSIEDRYGKEKANEIKEKASKRMKGSNNHMFGKPSPIGSGNGWSGWYKGYYFRSLLELSYLVYLIDNNIKFEHAEHKKYAVKYLNFEGKERNYFPDFYIFENDEIIEIKPKHLVNSVDNSAKFLAARSKYKNFKVITEDDIIKLSDSQIIELYELGDIKFIDRYDVKFKARYLCE